MIHQNAALAIAQRFGDIHAFVLAEDDAAVVAVYGVRVVEVADVLGEHFERLAEDAVGAAVDRVRVADGVDVGAEAVESAVDEEAGAVDCAL